MYIHHIEIENIRSIKHLHWQVDRPPGWHVIIGDNGSGKSTFLRAIALALVGPAEAYALRQNWSEWLNKTDSVKSGRVVLEISYDSNLDKFSGSGGKTKAKLLNVGVELLKQGNEVKPRKWQSGGFNPERWVWGGKSGWFSVAYGPFRRFAGGDKDYDKLFYSNPKLAAHLSVFGEDVALTECLRWLQELYFKQLERQPEGDLLNSIKDFVNQSGFLPHQARLHQISTQGIDFIDGNGCRLPVEDLSDGYRSILSMTFELIRQLARVYGEKVIFDPEDKTKIIAPGVVLIDEVDAHLHPTWQRKIGVWFREHFPNLQFIVTTHSPLICQAATVGTVWRLPKPGIAENAIMIRGQDLDRLLYGNVLDAYGTEMFGPNITRSEDSKMLMRRLAELNRKELRNQLNKTEQKEQEKLRMMMPTSAHTME
jgi:predicted ATPase